MATLIGGIAASHTPTIGFAVDRDKRDDPVWAPIFEAFAPVRAWLERQRPDVLLYIYNDHVTSFFFDHYSAFALGIGERWAVADEGGGPRMLPAIDGDPAFAAHLGRSLMADEFDMSFFQQRPLDHGVFSPLSMLSAHDGGWPTRLVPLQVGVLQFPIPTARRCFKLGQALRRAIESYPQPLRVAVVATGGLSHQVHGERAGFNNTEWDQRFLDLFERDPAQLAAMTHAQYAELGGVEGAEVIMWLVMRGALAPQVTCQHRTYYLPSMTGIATAIYEDVPESAVASTPVDPEAQLAGIERLEGSYPFTLERSVHGYRLNRFLHDLVLPDHRAAFLADPESAFERAALSEVERDLVRRRDWRGLIRYGAIFFVLEKLGAVVGVSNLHIYAAMRGETLEAFQRTRNAPGALYSVAGSGSLAWEKDKEQDKTVAGPAPLALKGLSSMATRQVLAALGRAGEEALGLQLRFESVGGVDASRRVAAGELVDLVVLATDAIDSLVATGHLLADSRCTIVESSVAVAVREGAPRPDIGSEASLRAAVLAAARIGYSTGPSGGALLSLFDHWGLGDTLRPRLVQARPGVPVATLLADGQVELGFQQYSELKDEPGIALLGPMPPALAIVTRFVGAVAAVSRHPEAARSMLAFMASPSTAAIKLGHGMAPPLSEPPSETPR